MALVAVTGTKEALIPVAFPICCHSFADLPRDQSTLACAIRGDPDAGLQRLEQPGELRGPAQS